jgi:hypothetical protein
MFYIPSVKFLIKAAMKKYFLNTSYKILVLGLFLSIIFSNSSFSQHQNKIYEDIGGGSGSTNTEVESNDDYTLYIVGGLLVTGIVVYALLRDKKENPTSDTTAAILDSDFLEKNLSYSERVANVQSKIPINISFGMQRDKALKDDKRYFVGLNYNF